MLGKLLKHLGEDRVVWGTDSIWFGTPQDQIQAMRTFQISAELQERYGYPALTRSSRPRSSASPRPPSMASNRPASTCDVSPADVEQIRATLPPARTYGPTTSSEAAVLIAAHQAGYAW